MYKLTFVSILLVSLIGFSLCEMTVRGVKLSDQNIYKGEYIECDGGKKVPIGRVNDDFCDCVDGSDEPGTSACPNGKFYCTNAGFKGSIIPSSWVDDNHCDCCDGSDESSKVCPNVCAEQAKAYRASTASEIQMQEKGLATRRQYVTEAEAERERNIRLIAELEKKLAELEQVVEQLETIKIKAEDAHTALQSEKEQKNAEKAENNKEHEEADKEADKETDAEKEELNREIHLDDPELLQAREDIIDQYYDDHEGLLDSFSSTFSDLSKYISSTFVGLWKSLPNPFLSERDRAINKYRDARDERDKTSKELEEARKMIGLDFGPDMAYHALYGKTFEFKDKEYTYKLNAFENVLQTKPGHSSNLGKWGNWESTNVMAYSNGDRCWGAPDRSSKVTFVCGDENKIINVQEPNKCEYTMVMKTPAACSQSALDALKNGE